MQDRRAQTSHGTRALRQGPLTKPRPDRLSVQVSEGGPVYQVEPFLHTVVRIAHGAARETVAGKKGVQGFRDGTPGDSLLRVRCPRKVA